MYSSQTTYITIYPSIPGEGLAVGITCIVVKYGISLRVSVDMIVRGMCRRGWRKSRYSSIQKRQMLSTLKLPKHPRHFPCGNTVSTLQMMHTYIHTYIRTYNIHPSSILTPVIEQCEVISGSPMLELTIEQDTFQMYEYGTEWLIFNLLSCHFRYEELVVRWPGYRNSKYIHTLPPIATLHLVYRSTLYISNMPQVRVISSSRYSPFSSITWYAAPKTLYLKLQNREGYRVPVYLISSWLAWDCALIHFVPFHFTSRNLTSTPVLFPPRSYVSPWHLYHHTIFLPLPRSSPNPSHHASHPIHLTTPSVHFI